jgi:hypothetical protein
MQTGGVQGVQEFEESKGKELVKRIGVSAYRRMGVWACRRFELRVAGSGFRIGSQKREAHLP